METTKDTTGVTSLVIDKTTGIATINGDAVKLPLMQFQLLAILASRPGEGFARDHLIETLWPDLSGMTSQDLYWHVKELRKAIGDSRRNVKLVANRRNFGYFLDIDPAAVTMVAPGTSRPVAAEPAALQEVLPEIAAAPPAAEPQETPRAEIPAIAPARIPARSRRKLPAAAAVIALLVASWGIGFVLAKWNSTRGVALPDSGQQQVGTESTDQDTETKTKPDKQHERNNNNKKKKRSDDSSVAAQPGGGSQDALAQGTSAIQDDQQTSGGDAQTKNPPAQPPAPTRYLYHLVHPTSGDHFVTTDGAVASEYEGKGYVGGAIARVYVTKEKNTKAVATNHGTAYIFISSAAKTDPPSVKLALYFATNNDGDFFYTTSKSEADQDGWSSSLIGYVRSPS